MASIPLRPPMATPMPIRDMHQSFSTSPLNMDTCDPRIMSTPFDSSRRSIDGPEYFAAINTNGLGDRSFPGGPFPPPRFDSGVIMGTYTQQDIDDRIRSTNLIVQFVNGHLTHAARYSQVQPKMASDGKFPQDFRLPKTVEEVKTMDPSCIDRILRAYGLPTDLRSLRLTTQFSLSPSPRAAHQAKLCTLFDFLGAVQISERQRVKRTACLP